jgi:hypothetical protein
MSEMMHPPRPRLAFRVGITGHRKGRLEENQLSRITSDISRIYHIVEQSVTETHSKHGAFYDAAAPVIRLISPLADGADSLAAQVALDHSFEIHAPIPFSKEDYETDFKGTAQDDLHRFLSEAASVYELDGGRQSDRDEAAGYLAAGYLTIKQADILIAIWDGEGARGLGGTGMIVEAAVQQGIPVIWVHAHEANDPCLLSEELTCDHPLSELAQVIENELVPPFVTSSEGEDPELAGERVAAEVFLTETEQRANYGIFYRLLEAGLCLKKPRGLSPKKDPYLPRTEEEYKAMARSLPDASDKALDRLSEVLLARYSWADNLALHYADIYRTSYSLNYLLSAVAVFLALLELVTGGWKSIWISIEVVTILVVLFITMQGKRNRWHEKWIDYRQLAEQLRHLRYLFLSGGQPRDSRNSQQSDGHQGSQSWVQWYYQSTVRELGLANIQCTDPFRNQLMNSYLNDELEPQISYHAAKSHTLHQMEHALHKFGEWSFGATLAICLSFLVVLMAAKFDPTGTAYAIKSAFKGWVTMATAFLPALGAASFGIRVQGEFASTSNRSQAMSRRLAATRDELKIYQNSGPPNLRDLRRNIETAIETMMIEIVDWKYVFSSKPLSLPA